VSQDPVRAAVTGNCDARQAASALALPLLTKSAFLQNNCLALFLQEGKRRRPLLRPATVGEFHPSSSASRYARISWAAPDRSRPRGRSRPSWSGRLSRRPPIRSGVAIRKGAAMEILTYELISDTRI